MRTNIYYRSGMGTEFGGTGVSGSATNGGARSPLVTAQRKRDTDQAGDRHVTASGILENHQRLVFTASSNRRASCEFRSRGRRRG